MCHILMGVLQAIRNSVRTLKSLDKKILLPNWAKYWLIFVLFYISAAVYYTHVEKWSIIDSVYFTTVTITTIGYGDVTPSTDNSRIFTIFVILFGKCNLISKKIYNVHHQHLTLYYRSFCSHSNSCIFCDPGHNTSD